MTKKHVDRPAPPVSAGDACTVVVERLGYRGEGVAKVEGFTVFVEGVLPGETARVVIRRVEASFATAALVELVTRSADRVAAPCGVFEVCGGCQLQHMNYEAQLRLKRQIVVDALTRIGRFAGDQVAAVVAPTRGMEDPWRYRNKVTVAAAGRDGQFVFGFVEEGTHEPVATDACLIRPVAHDDLLRTVAEVCLELDIVPYHAETASGDVRQVVVRTTPSGDATMIIVTQGAQLPHAAEVARRIAAKAPSGVRIAGIVQMQWMAPASASSDVRGRKGGARDAQGGDGSRAAGLSPGAEAPARPRPRVLWGQPAMALDLMGLVFRVSPLSFLQVNPLQTEVLYGEVLRLAAVQPDDVVLDLYSGIGTLSLLLAKSAKSVYGVESVPEATADAAYNATQNGLTNAHFVTNLAERATAELARLDVHPDIVVLDPPRAGCDRRVIAAIVEARPRKVVYVSCNPATLARDVALLAAEGYALDAAVPVDMFPQTAHVETVILMTRNKQIPDSSGKTA